MAEAAAEVVTEVATGVVVVDMLTEEAEAAAIEVAEAMAKTEVAEYLLVLSKRGRRE